MPAHKIDFYLNTSPTLRSLTAQARRAAELQQVFLNSAPPALTQACCVKQLRAGTLTLLADNAAIAAKLRQLTARLLTSYRKQGWQVTSIRIEVQVCEVATGAAAQREPRRLNAEAIEYVEKLAATLDDTPLKQALTRLAARQRAGN